MRDIHEDYYEIIILQYFLFFAIFVYIFGWQQ